MQKSKEMYADDQKRKKSLKFLWSSQFEYVDLLDFLFAT